MKNFKILKYSFLAFWLFIFWNFNYLFANNEYYYKNLTINADIQQDGTIAVNEIFDAYFNVPKHGIIRNIPLKYTIDGKKFRIFLENIKVDGRNFSLSENYGEKEIKIWDFYREVMGEQRYSIHYSVYGLIRNFAGKWREELSWNVIPNGFDTHIDHVHIELNLPKSYTWFTSEDFLIAADGRSNQLEDFEGTIDWSQGDKIILTYDKTIPAWNGITLAVKFPVGYFTFEHERQENLIDHWNLNMENTASIKTKDWFNEFCNRYFHLFDLFWEDSFLVGAFVLTGWVVILGFLWLRLWYKLIKLVVQWITQINERKLDKSDFPIVVQYEPPEWLNSAEVWLLYHRELREKDMLSLIYHWLNDNVIEIREREILSKKIFKVIKTKELLTDKKYEKWFFNILKRGERELNYITSIELHLQDLKKHGIEKWRLTGKTLSLTWSPFLLAAVWFSLFFILMYGVVDSAPTIRNLLWAVIFVFSIFVFIGYLIHIINRRDRLELTEKGDSLRAKILGYKEFLLMCDENRLRLYLQQDPLFFDKVLPYATVFWIESQLIKQIKTIGLPVESKWNMEWLNTLMTFEFKTYSPKSYSGESSDNDSSSSSYDRDSWFSSGSSFSRSSSSGRSGWGGWWGGGKSW